MDRIGVMPAESAPHERCLMAWPARRSLWGPHWDKARAEYAATANAIARFEPVTMVAAPEHVEDARELCHPKVTVIELPLDDSWMRDFGPSIVHSEDGERIGIDWKFNCWGEKMPPWDKDDAIAGQLLAKLGIRAEVSEFVMEGGSFHVDGEGTLITTEQCLLHPNRNPGHTREDIEAEFARTLGVEHVIWLPYGFVEDDGTDGHVDTVCCYVRPGVVIAQTVTDATNRNHERMQANLAVLRAARDARGRELEIIEMPYLPIAPEAGELPIVSYINFYIANGGIVLPVADAPTDADAAAIVAAAFPDREVVPVSGRILAYGGGGVHCITQQVPA